MLRCKLCGSVLKASGERSMKKEICYVKCSYCLAPYVVKAEVDGIRKAEKHDHRTSV